MKFCEAALKMKDGDIFRTDDGESNIYAYYGDNIAGILYNWSNGTRIKMSAEILEAEGKIIQTHQRVLTESEIVGKIMAMKKHCDFSINRKTLANIINLCQDNGRLEMWIEFKKVTDDIKSMTIPVSLEYAIEKLKP